MKDTIDMLTAEQMIQRLNGQQDIDMILAMGTGAGQLLANDQCCVLFVISGLEYN